METHNLKDKVILITGASDGIGKALAIACARAGAHTVLLGKSVKKLERLYDEITEQGYPEPALHPIDFTKTQSEDVYELVSHVHQLYGKLNAIVHCAGSYGQLTPTVHLNPKQWQDVVQVNLTAPYLITHAFLPLLAESEGSSIILFTLDTAQVGRAYWSAYSASKLGLQGFAQSLCEEWEHDGRVRIHCVVPENILTPSRLKAYPGRDQTTFHTPESIINRYLYLLSDAAKAEKAKIIPLQPQCEAID